MIQRWTIRRKAQVLVDLREGTVTPATLAALHGITAEELAAWRRDFAAHGRRGLRTTRIVAYRRQRRNHDASRHSQEPKP